MTKSFSTLTMITAVVLIAIAAMVYVPTGNACADGPAAEVASGEVMQAGDAADDELPTPCREWLDATIKQVRSQEDDTEVAIVALGDTVVYCDDAVEVLIEQLDILVSEASSEGGVVLSPRRLAPRSLGHLADRSPQAAGVLCAFLHEVKDDSSENAAYLIDDTLIGIIIAGPAVSAAWEDVLEIAQTTEDEYAYRRALIALGELGVWDAEIEAFLLATVQGDVPDAVAAGSHRAPRGAAIALGRIGFGDETREVLTEIVATWVQSDRYPDAPTGLEYRSVEALARNGEFDTMYPHLMAIGFGGSDELETAVFVTLTRLGPIASPMVEELEAMILDRETLEEGETTPDGLSLRMTRSVVVRLTTGQPVDEVLADELFYLLAAAAGDADGRVPVQAICALLGSSLERNPSIYARAVEMTQSDDRRIQKDGLLILANGVINPFDLGVPYLGTHYSGGQRKTPVFGVPLGGARSGWDPHRALPHIMRVIQETEHDFNWMFAVDMIPAMAPLTPEEIGVLREVALAQEDVYHRTYLAKIIEYCEWASENDAGE